MSDLTGKGLMTAAWVALSQSSQRARQAEQLLAEVPSCADLARACGRAARELDRLRDQAATRANNA